MACVSTKSLCIYSAVACDLWRGTMVCGVFFCVPDGFAFRFPDEACL